MYYEFKISSSGIYEFYGARRDKYKVALMNKSGYSMGGQSVHLSMAIVNSIDFIKVTYCNKSL